MIGMFVTVLYGILEWQRRFTYGRAGMSCRYL